nr:hypothetical protein [Streptomyces sp. 846.5]
MDTLSTVPDDPPAAGPDRALEPPPLAELLATALDPAVAEGDEDEVEERPTEAPITAAQVSPAAATQTPFFLFDSRRRTFLGRRPCSWVSESYAFMVALLHFRHLHKACLPIAW